MELKHDHVMIICSGAEKLESSEAHICNETLKLFSWWWLAELCHYNDISWRCDHDSWNQSYDLHTRQFGRSSDHDAVSDSDEEASVFNRDVVHAEGRLLIS